MQLETLVQIIRIISIVLGLSGSILIVYSLFIKNNSNFLKKSKTLTLVGIFFLLIYSFYKVALWKNINYSYITKEPVFLTTITIVFLLLYLFIFYYQNKIRTLFFDAINLASWVYVLFITVLEKMSFQYRELIFFYLFFNLLCFLLMFFIYKIEKKSLND